MKIPYLLLLIRYNLPVSESKACNGNKSLTSSNNLLHLIIDNKEIKKIIVKSIKIN